MVRQPEIMSVRHITTKSLINTDYFIDDSLIGVEVEGEAGVVLLDEYS